MRPQLCPGGPAPIRCGPAGVLPELNSAGLLGSWGHSQCRGRSPGQARGCSRNLHLNTADSNGPEQQSACRAGVTGRLASPHRAEVRPPRITGTRCSGLRLGLGTVPSVPAFILSADTGLDCLGAWHLLATLPEMFLATKGPCLPRNVFGNLSLNGCPPRSHSHILISSLPLE